MRSSSLGTSCYSLLQRLAHSHHRVSYGIICSDITTTSPSLLVTTTEWKAVCLCYLMMDLPIGKCKYWWFSGSELGSGMSKGVCVDVPFLTLISDIKQEAVPQVIIAWCSECPRMCVGSWPMFSTVNAASFKACPYPSQPSKDGYDSLTPSS